MPMTQEQLADTVRRLAAEQVSVDPDGVTLETDLFADLNFDSLDAVDFTMKLEDEFGVTIDDEQATGVRTVGQAVELLMSLRR